MPFLLLLRSRLMNSHVDDWDKFEECFSDKLTGLHVFEMSSKAFGTFINQLDLGYWENLVELHIRFTEEVPEGKLSALQLWFESKEVIDLGLSGKGLLKHGTAWRKLYESNEEKGLIPEGKRMIMVPI